MEQKTQLQRQIENYVTSGRGYDRHNTERTPNYLKNTEIEVQIALMDMDTVDGKTDWHQVIGFSYNLERMIKKFNRAGISLEVITDANGFKKAYYNCLNDWKDNISFEPIKISPQEMLLGLYIASLTDNAQKRQIISKIKGVSV